MAQEVVEVHCVKMQTFEPQKKKKKYKIRPSYVCFSQKKEKKKKTIIIVSMRQVPGEAQILSGSFQGTKKKKKNLLKASPPTSLSPHIQIHVSVFTFTSCVYWILSFSFILCIHLFGESRFYPEPVMSPVRECVCACVCLGEGGRTPKRPDQARRSQINRLLSGPAAMQSAHCVLFAALRQNLLDTPLDTVFFLFCFFF